MVMAAKLAQGTAAAAAVRRGTLGIWGRYHFIVRRPDQGIDMFLDQNRPSRLTHDRADGVMVTKNNDVLWEPPRMHLGLYQLCKTGSSVLTTVPTRSTGAGTARGGDTTYRFWRHEVSGAPSSREQYLRAFEKHGILSGSWDWNCDGPLHDDGDAVVDDDWDKLATAMDNGQLPDCVEAIVCRGPIGPPQVKHEMYGNQLRGRSGDYRFMVFTSNFRDKEQVGEVNFALRSDELKLVAPADQWLQYYPSGAMMLDWRLPLWYGPPSGGEPLDHRDTGRYCPTKSDGIHRGPRTFQGFYGSRKHPGAGGTDFQP